jgi:CheY-like chemotaxis protein
MIKYAIIIDDDAVHNLICERLLRYSHQVEEVLCFRLATEALEWLCSQPAKDLPELILLDINMPIMDGWGFLEQLNLDFPEHSSQIAILTSSVSADDRRKSQSYASLTDYLSKPLTLEKLSHILDQQPAPQMEPLV